MYRSRYFEKAYKKSKTSRTTSACQFCNVPSSELVKEGEFFKIIINLFPYSFWDQSQVVEHLMIVPKRHIVSQIEYTDQERIEYMKLTAEYEEIGYNIYARAPLNSAKSVLHQHTHLIKTSSNLYKYIFFSKKPYIQILK